MRLPAPFTLAFGLLLAVAVQTAAASERFRPDDPGFVVANIRTATPDTGLAALIAAHRAHAADPGASLALARAYVSRARSQREPRFFGRAEALLEPLARMPDAAPQARLLYAQVLQFRHEFTAAETLLDGLLQESPRDSEARVLRASIHLVRGNFAAARADCARLVGIDGAHAAHAVIGIACLAQSMAGSGELARARALLDEFLPRAAGAPAAARAYLLATRAELAERSNRTQQAIADYATALSLAPADDALRAALADALSAGGDRHAARELLAVERPALALLVRRALLEHGAARERLTRQAARWLALETTRGDGPHRREAAMLALGDPHGATRALAAAELNFATQRELADVRLLARAASAAGDDAAAARLQHWLRATGYRDAVTESILARLLVGS